jgi:quercetin dioxygenase-like cupin family protein
MEFDMKLGDKIRKIRKDVMKIRLKDLHDKLTTIFGRQAISYKSLIRIENNQLDGRLKSIHQIACVLGMDVKELLSGTDRELTQEKAILADIIRKKARTGKFAYNDKAYIEMMGSKNASFVGMELVLEPGGKTKIEEDPENTEMFLIVTKGKITVDIHNEIYSIGVGDSIYFKSHLPHRFENHQKKPAKGIIIKDPFLS